MKHEISSKISCVEKFIRFCGSDFGKKVLDMRKETYISGTFSADFKEKIITISNYRDDEIPVIISTIIPRTRFTLTRSNENFYIL